MQKLLLIVLIFSFGVTCADARSRGRHPGHYRFWYANPPGGLPNPADRYLSRGFGAVPDESSLRRYRDGAAELVPADWELRPTDPTWRGKRYVSPDGLAWAAIYASPVEEDEVSAHMKAIAFADGETITYLRGEHNQIAVSGVKGDRIFYREAVLACAGKHWHHIAFEYPREAESIMEEFVSRASDAVQDSESDGCDTAMSTR
jgi:serine/threonine-protein kinase